MRPIFIKFRGDTINITKITDIAYSEDKEKTHICYDVGKGVWGYYDGDCRNELWDLVKLVMKPKDGDTMLDMPILSSTDPDLERRVAGIEEKIGEKFTIKNREPNRPIIGYLENGDAVYGT